MAALAAIAALACGSEEPPPILQPTGIATPATTALASEPTSTPPPTQGLVGPENPVAGRPFVTPPVVFTLPVGGGGEVALADYIGKRPVVVVFYRGFFWGICQAQLVELQSKYEVFRELGAEIVAVSTDTVDDAVEIVEIHGLEFPVAYDRDGDVVRGWGVFDLLGDGVAAPATFVFDAGGELAAWRVGTDIADRPSADDILLVLRQLNVRQPPEKPVLGPTVTPAPTPTAIAVTATLATPSLGPGLHDFKLPQAIGEPISLSSYLGEKNVVLVFYRAFWWTFCRRQLVELSQNYEAIQARDAEVLAISTDDLASAEYAVERFQADFPILYTSKDPSVPKAYRVFDLHGDGLASASVFIMDKQGQLAWSEIGDSYTHQVAASTIVEQLSKIGGGDA